MKGATCGLSTARTLSLTAILLALRVSGASRRRGSVDLVHQQPAQHPRGQLAVVPGARPARYAERVYDHVVNGVGQFEVHLGPRREFAIFQGCPGRAPRPRLAGQPAQAVSGAMEGTRARQRWDVPSLKLAFTVTLGGGSPRTAKAGTSSSSRSRRPLTRTSSRRAGRALREPFDRLHGRDRAASCALQDPTYAVARCRERSA